MSTPSDTTTAATGNGKSRLLIAFGKAIGEQTKIVCCGTRVARNLRRHARKSQQYVSCRKAQRQTEHDFAEQNTATLMRPQCRCEKNKMEARPRLTADTDNSVRTRVR